jgi:SWI/SNF related-matrix-associated actin-dependent regulator of chromatin subfamily C
LLAEREEREIEKLVYEVIEAQLQKLEIKMKCFDELEDVLKEEQLKVNNVFHFDILYFVLILLM